MERRWALAAQIEKLMPDAAILLTPLLHYTEILHWPVIYTKSCRPEYHILPVIVFVQEVVAVVLVKVVGLLALIVVSLNLITFVIVIQAIV